MIKLLKIEFIKFTRSSVFYIFLGLYVALVLLWELTIVTVSIKGGGKLTFPETWGDLVYWASWLNFFLGLIILISITTDFQFRTFRQHIVDGLRKTDIFAAKYMYSIGLVVFAVVSTAIIVLAMGAAYSPAGSNLFNGIQILGRYFIQILGYMSMAVFFAFLFRNTAVAIIVYLFYMPIESLVGVALNFLVFHSPKTGNIPKYLPKTLFSDIVAQPAVVKLATSAAGLNTGGPSQQTELILGCAYILAFAGATYWLLQKRDM